MLNSEFHGMHDRRYSTTSEDGRTTRLPYGQISSQISAAALVDGEDDGHILLAEEGCDIAVEHRAALLAVDDHHSNVSLTQRRERLLSDLRQEDLVGVVVEDLSRVELSG